MSQSSELNLVHSDIFVEGRLLRQCVTISCRLHYARSPWFTTGYPDKGQTRSTTARALFEILLLPPYNYITA